MFHSYDVVPDYGMFYGKQYSKVSLFGGGTVLPFVSFWSRRNLYNYAFGVGVRDLSFSPEFSSKEVITKTRNFNFRLLGVRGENSRKTLREWGIDSEVVGDPCLLLQPRSHIRRDYNLVGLNFSSLEAIWGGDARGIVREGIRICNFLMKKGYSVILIPFRTDDLPALKEIALKTGAPIFDRGNDVLATMDLIASCKVLIGEILPSVIFSAAAYTPFVMIAYQPKCLDFIDTVGLGEYTVRTDEMTCETVMALMENLLDNWNKTQNQLMRRVNAHRDKLSDFALRIMEDIESRSPDVNWSTPGILGGVNWFAYQHLDRLLYRRVRRIWGTAHRVGERIKNL